MCVFITYFDALIQSLLDTTRQALIYNLTKVQNRVAEGLVPWFTNQMPESYFKQVTLLVLKFTQSNILRFE